MLQNDDGSIAEFGNTGSATGYGGYEGLGIGNPSSYTPAPRQAPTSYSQEAMASALAAADRQALATNQLAPVTNQLAPATDYFPDWSTQQQLDNDTGSSMLGGADKTGRYMDAYTGGHPQVADRAEYVARKDDWNTLTSREKKMARKAAEAVGMNMDYMADADKDNAWRRGLNTTGSLFGGIIGGPLLSYLGGGLGDYIMASEDDMDIRRAAGLLGPRINQESDRHLSEGNSLARRIIWPPRRGARR